MHRKRTFRLHIAKTGKAFWTSAEWHEQFERNIETLAQKWDIFEYLHKTRSFALNETWTKRERWWTVWAKLKIPFHTMLRGGLFTWWVRRLGNLRFDWYIPWRVPEPVYIAPGWVEFTLFICTAIHLLCWTRSMKQLMYLAFTYFDIAQFTLSELSWAFDRSFLRCWPPGNSFGKTFGSLTKRWYKSGLRGFTLTCVRSLGLEGILEQKRMRFNFFLARSSPRWRVKISGFDRSVSTY